MTNENCLEGIQCPQCGQQDHFLITGVSTFSVYDDGTDGHGDVAWDDEAHTRCPACNYGGSLVLFRCTVHTDGEASDGQ